MTKKQSDERRNGKNFTEDAQNLQKLIHIKEYPPNSRRLNPFAR